MDTTQLVKIIFVIVAALAALTTIFLGYKKKPAAATASVAVMVVAGLVAFVASFTGPQ